MKGQSPFPVALTNSPWLPGGPTKESDEAKSREELLSVQDLVVNSNSPWGADMSFVLNGW